MGMCLKQPFDGGMCAIGQVVVSRRGKDAGRWYVVVGVSEAVRPDGRARVARVYVADGKKYTVLKPKAKNPAHLQRTRWVLDEIERSILSRRLVDAGRFQALLTGLKERNSIEEPASPAEAGTLGAFFGEDEVIACPAKAK